MKLQQAYFSERSEAGGWQLIGYMAPGVNSKTTNFEYAPGSDIGTASSIALATSDKLGWQAHNVATLNECAIGDNWKVNMKIASGSATAQDVIFTAWVKAGGCSALTPTFDKIGK